MMWIPRDHVIVLLTVRVCHVIIQGLWEMLYGSSQLEFLSVYSQVVVTLPSSGIVSRELYGDALNSTVPSYDTFFPVHVQLDAASLSSE